ncbi:C-GCAxxG-C-C family protein [Labilibacter marinus]|uniref:C-GCAxxG-C-C family protein n=1 Tax=Labilibacter marinus TaxID=1477105 RepID=UPI0008344EDD|nr:C-GCAxxG-C-C family protein [Labilibacter marinus]
MTLKDKLKLAQDKFSNNCNCAQSALIGLASDKLDVNALEMMSSAFGGGIAQQGKTCGAITGALMALGVYEGYTEAQTANKPAMYNKAQAFLKEFERQNGSSQCCDLLGYDMSIPEEKAKAVESGLFNSLCPKLVMSAVEIMDEIIHSKPE